MVERAAARIDASYPNAADLHVHTSYSKDVTDTRQTPLNILEKAAAAEIPAVGFADHYHPGHNAPEPAELLDLRAFVDAGSRVVPCYFGIEASILDRSGTTTVDGREPVHFDYVIASIHPHYPRVEAIPFVTPATFIDFLQEMYMNVLANPRVDVVGHPWNLHAKSTGDNTRSFWGACRALGLSPAECFEMIPDSYFRQFAAAARAAGKAVEMNAYGIATGEIGSLYDEDNTERIAFGAAYLRLFRIAADEGLRFTVGSDAHALSQVGDTRLLCRYLLELKIGPDRLWLPKSKQEMT